MNQGRDCEVSRRNSKPHTSTVNGVDRQEKETADTATEVARG